MDDQVTQNGMQNKKIRVVSITLLVFAISGLSLYFTGVYLSLFIIIFSIWYFFKLDIRIPAAYIVLFLVATPFIYFFLGSIWAQELVGIIFLLIIVVVALQIFELIRTNKES